MPLLQRPSRVCARARARTFMRVRVRSEATPLHGVWEDAHPDADPELAKAQRNGEALRDAGSELQED